VSTPQATVALLQLVVAGSAQQQDSVLAHVVHAAAAVLLPQGQAAGAEVWSALGIESRPLSRCEHTGHCQDASSGQSRPSGSYDLGSS
jgi:hypothetical protein